MSKQPEIKESPLAGSGLSRFLCLAVTLAVFSAGDIARAENATPAARSWPLDAVDADVIIHGSAQIAPGAKGKSLALDGRSVIELGDSSHLNQGSEGFTFSVWFNPSGAFHANQVIAAKARYSSAERQWSLILEPGSTLKAFLHQGNWKTISTGEKIQPDQWHQVVLSVGGGTATLYLDGRPIGETMLAQSIPDTGIPITVGGVDDNGKLLQTFRGRVDEARFEPRALGAAEVAAGYQPVGVAVAAPKETPKPATPAAPVWLSDQPVPLAAELGELKGTQFHIVKAMEPNLDGGYKWLHGVALVWHKGKLYASFGNNKGSENTVGEEARSRVSEDGGKTWGETFTIATPNEPNLGISHGVFLSRGGELWSFHGAFYGSKLMDPAAKVHTRAYKLNEATGSWESKGTVIEGGFWPMQEPQKMDDGNWIMSGLRVGDGHPAAVAISHGDDLTRWDLVVIPKSAPVTMWGESAVIVDGKRVQNFARNQSKLLVLTAVSEDYGRTWSESSPGNLPMVQSKPYAGTLSSGQRYLICTTTAEMADPTVKHHRAPLTIAVGRAGENGFRKIFRIRDSVCPESPGRSNPAANLSYPYAVEHDGALYVGFTNNGAELAVIPIKALQVE